MPCPFPEPFSSDFTEISSAEVGTYEKPELFNTLLDLSPEAPLHSVSFASSLRKDSVFVRHAAVIYKGRGYRPTMSGGLQSPSNRAAAEESTGGVASGLR